MTIGSWITLAHTAIAEIMAKRGFDWLTVDMEHSAITLDKTEDLVRTIELSGVTPLVRVGENNPNLIKRVMDIGAHGVIVPMVNTEEDAVKAVNAVKYPPLGTRGVGLARAQGYGLEFEKYKRWVNKESIVIVQIEHIKAVDNLHQILSVDGIDGYIAGPYDLSASLGRPGDLGHRDVENAFGKTMKVARKYNVQPGIHVVSTDAREVLKRKRQGYRFIAYGFDALFLGTSSGEGLARIKRGK